MTEIKAHPSCPPNILAEQVGLEVMYRNFSHQITAGTIEVNQAVVDDVQAFFRQAFKLKFPFEKVVRASDIGFDDMKLMVANATSGFNYRQIPNSAKLSQHAFGRAFDVNTRLNPYIIYRDGHRTVLPDGAEWDPRTPGTLHPDHPLVEFMQARGWTWGGEWTKASGRIDYQHFEKPAETN